MTVNEAQALLRGGEPLSQWEKGEIVILLEWLVGRLARAENRGDIALILGVDFYPDD